MAELPSSVGLPQEMMLGSLDYSLPPDAKSYSIKVQPSNVSQVVSSFTTPATTTNATMQDQPATVQNIIFDLPCGASPSMFIDNRFTTLNFTATLNCTNTSGATNFGILTLRSSAYAWFDRMFLTSQNGQIIEDVGEFGLTNDTLIALQMNSAVRHGSALQYGFNTGNIGNSASQFDYEMYSGCNGRQFEICTTGLATGNTETHSYSIPLTSGVIGVLADKFLNIGRTSKLQLVLQTSSVLPLSYAHNTTASAGNPTYSITLSNFSLQCEYVDVGINALQMLDQTLVDGKSYIHGTTWRTSTATLPSTTGAVSLLAGVRASSVKSLFVRFAQGGLFTNHGKYDALCPLLNGINFNVGGIKYPQTPINPLLCPSQAFRETQLAIGSWNNSNFSSAIAPSYYCRLSAGGLNNGVNNGSTQDNYWYTGSLQHYQSQFIFGENVEVCMRRGLLSGLNCTSAPIFLELNVASAPTNTHTCYVQAMLDHVVIHDVRSGDIQIRI